MQAVNWRLYRRPRELIATEADCYDWRERTLHYFFYFRLTKIIFVNVQIPLNI
jgi:hypothetical protein